MYVITYGACHSQTTKQLSAARTSHILSVRGAELWTPKPLPLSSAMRKCCTQYIRLPKPGHFCITPTSKYKALKIPTG